MSAIMDEPQTLQYVINNVFLPPKLPQEDDTTPMNEVGMLEILSGSLEEFRQYVDHDAVDMAKKMVDELVLMLEDGTINEARLSEIMKGFHSRGMTDSVCSVLIH
jgi:hypothetical protein